MPFKKKSTPEPVITLPSSVPSTLPPMQMEKVIDETSTDPPVVGVPPELPPLEPPSDLPPHLATPTLDVSLERPIPKTSSSSHRPLMIILLVVLALGLAGTAIWMFSQSSSTTTITLSASPTPSSTVEPTPSPSPEPTLDRAEITLEILNGTDTAGLAGKNATIFEDLGYKIENTGNAEEDATVNMFYVKAELESQLGALLQDVERELNISSVSGYLDEDSEVMARIILGEE